MHQMPEYACRRNLPSDLDQRRYVALARDVGLGRIGRIATLTEPWVTTCLVGMCPRCPGFICETSVSGLVGGRC